MTRSIVAPGPMPHRFAGGRLPLRPPVLGSMAWAAAKFLGILAALVAFAFECAASTLLLVALGLGASGHPARPGPAGIVACSALLAATLGLLYWTVRLLLALNADATRATAPARVVVPRLEPLWDRYLDG